MHHITCRGKNTNCKLLQGSSWHGHIYFLKIFWWAKKKREKRFAIWFCSHNHTYPTNQAAVVHQALDWGVSIGHPAFTLHYSLHIPKWKFYVCSSVFKVLIGVGVGGARCPWESCWARRWCGCCKILKVHKNLFTQFFKSPSVSFDNRLQKQGAHNHVKLWNRYYFSSQPHCIFPSFSEVKVLKVTYYFWYNKKAWQHLHTVLCVRIGCLCVCVS